MNFKIKMDPDNQRVILGIDKLVASQTRAIRRAFYYIGKDLVHASKKSIMEKPKHGRLYKLKRNGVTRLHRASAPGEAPANFTGSLKHALDFNVIGGDRMEFGVRQIFQNRKGTPAGVTYGKYLELGTSKMAARPFLKPAIKKNLKNIREHFERSLQEVINEDAK